MIDQFSNMISRKDMRKGSIAAFMLLTWLFATKTVLAEQQETWAHWVAQVRVEALAEGIKPDTFDRAFADVHEPSKQVKGLSRTQPEHRLTYDSYLHSRVDNYRITIGRREYKKNQAILDAIAKQYHVDPCFIVSFWGMETSYGSYMGNFPVIKSLATLAYDSKRRDFFRKELFLALHILNDGHVALADFKGEWAGASGQSQFLPSSWVKYAVDYDGDGHKDIWKSKPDVFASIANYMTINGWHQSQPWAIYVALPKGFPTDELGKSIVKPVSAWEAMGVRTERGESLPYPMLEASLVQPNGGPVFLAYPNYKMILRYNNSIYYAGAIGYLADKICSRTP
jgi:membrane-bound lytic murein transglycosylase B